MYLASADGGKEWRPTQKQERFLQIPLTVKEGFYAGAVNAGKSDVLLFYPIVRGWHEHPEFKGIFFRRTKPELRNEIIPRAINYFRPLGATFNQTFGIFTFPSGALYFMAHCEHEKDVHDYDSMQPNYAAFDELTSFTEWIYLYITIERVRVNKNLEGVLPQIVRSGSNPGNIGHPWVYKRFIKPYPEGGKILIGRGGIKRVFIPATIDDNPHASEQYKKELDALPEAERKAKKYGDWTAYEGQVFDEFRDKLYPGEPPHAVHVIEPFEIPKWWPRIVAIDWGFSALTSIGWGAISPKGRVYIYRHQHFRKKKIEEWAPQVKYYIDKEQPEDVVICHSANQNRSEPHTIHEQVQEALGVPVRLGEKDRISGKILLHEYLRWKAKEIPADEVPIFDQEMANWLLRNKGEHEYHRYLSLFQPLPVEDNIPKLLFFNDKQEDIKIITESIKSCVYEKADLSGKKKEDVAEFDGDDPYDMIRMLLHSADAYFAQAAQKQKELDRIDGIVRTLQETQDWTTYYRNMRAAEQPTGLQPLRRFHGRSLRAH